MTDNLSFMSSHDQVLQETRVSPRFVLNAAIKQLIDGKLGNAARRECCYCRIENHDELSKFKQILNKVFYNVYVLFQGKISEMKTRYGTF